MNTQRFQEFKKKAPLGITEYELHQRIPLRIGTTADDSRVHRSSLTACLMILSDAMNQYPRKSGFSFHHNSSFDLSKGVGLTCVSTLSSDFLRLSVCLHEQHRVISNIVEEIERCKIIRSGFVDTPTRYTHHQINVCLYILPGVFPLQDRRGATTQITPVVVVTNTKQYYRIIGQFARHLDREDLLTSSSYR